MISRVYLKNWKSHHETELTFSEGVNVLVGEMGSGKSSVVEGILFALYGTTPALQSRKVTLDKLVRRTPSRANECIVEADFESDGETYTVRREIVRDGENAKTDTSELRKGGVDGELVEAPQTSAVTEKLENLLGVDYELFSRSIYAEQNQLDYFLTLRSGERKKKVDELLELDRFETARKTLVSVINRLEDRRKNREDDLERMQDDIDTDAIQGLEEKLEAGKEELEELQETKDELDEQYEQVTERFEALIEKKERFNALNEKRTALKTRIKALAEQIEATEEKVGDLSTISENEIVERRTQLQEEKQELQEMKENMDQLAKQVSVLQDRKEQNQEKLEELGEQAEKVEQLEDISDALEERLEDLESVKKQRQETRTRLADVKKSLQNLASASESCPTCGQELTDEHRVQFLQERKQEKSELSERINELDEQKDQLTGEVDALKEKREELLQYRDVDEKIEDTEEALDQIAEKLEARKEQLDELQEAYSEDRIEAVNEERTKLKTVEELLELREEREEREEQFEAVCEELEDLAFDEDTLEAVREKRSELEKQREVVANDIDNRQDMIRERAKRLEELREKQERMERYEEQIVAYRDKHDMLNRLLKALETTQVELRQQFIDTVNELMAETWQQVYPYDDYTGIRMNAEDGYLLELEDTEGNWIAVDGEVSGGERHTAALTLRVALSMLLTPNWRILVLDEPTHNLDVTAIEELAETLRTQVSDLMGQMFLITHEERLETAATGDLYKLSKKDTETGLTRVEQAADIVT